MSTQQKEIKNDDIQENTKIDRFLSSKASLQQKIDDFTALRDAFDGNEYVYRRPLAGGLNGQTLVHDRLNNETRKMLMFGSNNYLGLANHPEVIKAATDATNEYGLSMSGSPVLSGSSKLHVELEQKMSNFKGYDDCVLFSSGYCAQQAWMTALLSKDDIVFYDAYSHTSFTQGLEIVACKSIPFRHNNIEDLRKKLQRRRNSRETAWIFLEGVYSMHGDKGALADIAQLAQEFNCYLAVDDAHGAGVLGNTGRGISELSGISAHDIDIYLGTFSKAFGAVGGFVCCTHDMAEYIRCFGKPHMFSASLAIPVVAGISTALDILDREPERVAALKSNVEHLLKAFSAIGIDTHTDSAIVPVDIPQGVNMRRMAIDFHQRGVFVNSVEYPAVPLDQQRFRITVSAMHSIDEIDALVDVFHELFIEHGLLNAP